ncbi:transcriptional regulator, MerR family [Limosilactobacillus panis DSM 6035]|uniref:Transcriptional regulator, MerR family n=2 Tax=Lactobacillaceae TaxID=33958 RepID=A0A0R1XAP6_9LACO|nr:transcriptional regulator, MerR family [Limosilactobacillus panis DSM 6035]
MLKDQFRRMLSDDKLQITMTELAQVTGVSTSQIRYWERKGYIKSSQDEKNKNHRFKLFTIFRVYTIKYFLDQGYTLAMAVQKEQERQKLGRIFQRFMADQIVDIHQDEDESGEVVLGKLAEDPTKEVYAKVDQDGSTLHLRSVGPRSSH